MVAVTQTVRNTIMLHGGSLSLWGTLVWGTNNWGYADDDYIIQSVQKLVENSQAATTTNGFQVQHLVEDSQAATTANEFDIMHVYSNSQGSDSSNILSNAKVIQNTQTLDSNDNDLGLWDGSGYEYVYPSNETNLINRDTPTWSSGTAGATTWSSGTASTTSWSSL
jgi:hypothetical protein